jgi:rod shape-determining protein MreB and related proteins
MTRLATSDQGLIFNEPTHVAVDTRSGQVVEVGYGALEKVAQSARHVSVFRPLSQGATVDFDVTARLMSGLFDRAGISKLSRARVVLSVPSLATAIERRALRQAAVQAGAREVSLIEAPLAAAIGLGLPVQNPVGSAIGLFGGGASEVAVISLGGIVTGAGRRVGGFDIDQTIATLLRTSVGVVVSPGQLEILKNELGSALNTTRGSRQVVLARTVDTGRLVEVEVTSELVNQALQEVTSVIVRMVQDCLGDTPPDLSQDVSSMGLTLVGGLSQLQDIDALLADNTGVAIGVAYEPDLAVIKGLVMCLQEMSSLHALFRNADR